MKSEDPSNVSPSKAPKNPGDSDTVTDSNPPMPQRAADGQLAPEAFGQQSYTSRQPWMSEDTTVVDEQGSSSGFVVDGATLTPFGDKGAGSPQTDTGKDVESGAGEADATNKESPPPPEPVIRRRSRGNGALFSLFLLFAKAVPLMLVLVGGYYTYSFYFGPIPIIDQTWRKTASLVGVSAPPPEEKSKAGKILQQTRDVVNANDQRVNFASALADENVDLNALSTPQDMPRPAPKAASTTTTVTVEQTSPQAKSGPGLTELAGNLADTIKSKLASAADENVESPVEAPKASPAFITWVNRARISGVRRGVNPKIYINDLPVNPGDVIYRPLEIKVVGIDPHDTYLTFQDKTGATYRRRY